MKGLTLGRKWFTGWRDVEKHKKNGRTHDRFLFGSKRGDHPATGSLFPSFLQRFFSAFGFSPGSPHFLHHNPP